MLRCIIVKTTLQPRKSCQLDSNEAPSVKFVKELFSSDLSGKLACVKSKFLVVSKTIATLQAVGVEMNGALDIVKSAERAVEQARDKVAENVKKQIQESAGAK